MRTFLLAVLLVAGCEGKKKAPEPAPVKPIGVTAETDDPPPPPEEDPDEIVGDRSSLQDLPREHGVPARKACKPDCEAMHAKQDSWNCSARAPGVVMTGQEEHIVCHPDEVTIDCCAPIKADDLPAITKALGWEKATPDQRASIAWLVTRVVMDDVAIEKAPADLGSGATFSAPTATAGKDGGVVLDYWTLWIENLHPHHVHQKVTFDAKGKATQEKLADVEATEDPALARQQAIEQAKKAGVLKTAPLAGSGSK